MSDDHTVCWSLYTGLLCCRRCWNEVTVKTCRQVNVTTRSTMYCVDCMARIIFDSYNCFFLILSDFNMQHPALGTNSLTLSVSLIHILVFHLLTTLHKSDPHCHHHLCHHQSLLLFFTLHLKHISSSSLFHRRRYHRYSLNWSHRLPAGPFFFCSQFLVLG